MQVTQNDLWEAFSRPGYDKKILLNTSQKAMMYVYIIM